MKCHAHGGHGAGLSTAGKNGLIATVLANASKHPVLIFGIGLTIGIYIHKNRSKILQEADQSTE